MKSLSSILKVCWDHREGNRTHIVPGSEANRPFSSFLHILWVILRHHATHIPLWYMLSLLCWCNSFKDYSIRSEWERPQTPKSSKSPLIFWFSFFPPFSFHVWLISWLGSIFFKILRNFEGIITLFLPSSVVDEMCLFCESSLKKLLGFLLSPFESRNFHSTPFLWLCSSQGLHYMFLGLLNGLSGLILYACHCSSVFAMLVFWFCHGKSWLHS